MLVRNNLQLKVLVVLPFLSRAVAQLPTRIPVTSTTTSESIPSTVQPLTTVETPVTTAPPAIPSSPGPVTGTATVFSSQALSDTIASHATAATSPTGSTTATTVQVHGTEIVASAVLSPVVSTGAAMAPTATSSTTSVDHRSHTAAIIGAIIGALILTLVIVVIAFLWRKPRRGLHEISRAPFVLAQDSTAALVDTRKSQLTTTLSRSPTNHVVSDPPKALIEPQQGTLILPDATTMKAPLSPDQWSPPLSSDTQRGRPDLRSVLSYISHARPDPPQGNDPMAIGSALSPDHRSPLLSPDAQHDGHPDLRSVLSYMSRTPLSELERNALVAFLNSPSMPNAAPFDGLRDSLSAGSDVAPPPYSR